MALTSNDIITALALRPHPEGGHYRETYRGPALPWDLPERGMRASSTAIYFLLCAGEFSAFHVVASDEAWHYYAGSPLELITLGPGGALEVVILGTDLTAAERPQHVVPAGVLQAARTLGADYSLCGCTVAPGFEYADFEMPSREHLHAAYPQHRDLLTALTRG